MTCEVCGRYACPDALTGYDGDDICGYCQSEGWTRDADGTLTQDPPPVPIRRYRTMDDAAELLIDAAIASLRSVRNR